MESGSCTDHAYAAVHHTSGTIIDDDTKKVLQNEVDVVRLNDLNDSANHEPLCMSDMNANGRDVNGTESTSDEMETKEESKPSEEKDKLMKDKGMNADKSGFDAGLCTVLNVKSVFNEKCVNNSNVIDAKQSGCEVEKKGDIANESSSTELCAGSVKASNTNSSQANTDNSEAKQSQNKNMDVEIQGSDKIGGSTDQVSEETSSAVNDDHDYDADTDGGEEVVEMESQIKSDEGNGIIMSLTRKRSDRTGKRKAVAVAKTSPSKFRRVAGISTRRSPRISAVNGNSNIDNEGAVDEDNQDAHKNVGTGDHEEEDMEDETARSTSEERRLRSQRSASLSDSSVQLTDTNSVKNSDLMKTAATTPTVITVKSPPNRKHLFFKGKKAAPAPTKPLSEEELEKYTAPFDQGWRRELVFRGTYENTTKTQADTYYFPPSRGPKLRSMVQISEWLNTHDTTLTTDNFTFMRRAIGVKGELVRNASQSRGRASMEAAVRKRNLKHVKDEHVHDDNDGQFDKPEIVIERDSDDFIGHIMTVVNQEDNAKTEAKVDPGLPKLEELAKTKEGKSEIMSTNEHVTFVKKKISPKATARKSTTQKTFRKSISQTGVENLCSLNCPGLQGMPPMLHCNVCMCLFHQECVNFFGQNGEFVCYRCKDMHQASTTGTTIAPSTLQASNPTMLKHLHVDRSSPTAHAVYKAFPNGDKVQEVDVHKSKNSSSIIIKPVISKGQTPPASTMPLYKALPFSSISPSPSVSTSLSYPVLLTPNASLITPPSSLFPVSIATTISTSVPSAKSPFVDSVNSGVSEYSAIRPLIKQEPIDDSYDEQKMEKNIKASSEALFNLKNVLSSRIGNSNFEKYKTDLSSEKNSAENLTKLQTHKPIAVASKPLKTSMNSLPMFGNIFSPPTQFNALPQTIAQPRMNFGNFPPPQMQFGPSAGFRLVPVGPPIPLGGMQVPVPMVPSPGLVRMTSSPTSSTTTSKSHRTPTTEPKKICPKASTIVVSTQDDLSPTGPLIVNAKTVTPLNGQMLTLPPPVVKKLSLTKSLALKINNKQITVPPSGFFHSEEGLKVFLPPNTFPTADENNDNVSVVENRISVEQSEKQGENNNLKSPDGQKDSNRNDNSCEKSVDSRCAKKLDIRKNKYYSKCCLIQRIYGMYDCMAHIFKYLTLQELLNMGLVCKTWRKIIQSPDLWIDVRFKDVRIKDWEMALKFICKRDVQSISLVGVSHFEDHNRTWHQLVSSIHVLSSIKKISFCHIPSPVLQTMAGKLTQLESLCAEMITDFVDDTMWEVPSKLDVGNFCAMKELRELKLRGPGGLTLPSFNFGCGLSDIGKLSNLRILHLTSLRNIRGSDFNFISSLCNVEDLALGDCEQWKEETYSHLKEMTSLRSLRLECGGDTAAPGLEIALCSLKKLETLELWKYAFASTFADHVCDLKHLNHLCVFPVSAYQVAEVNTNTLNAVKQITHLKTLDWVFQEDNSSTIILSDCDSKDNDQWIPFQSVGCEGNKETPSEYISVKQLKEKHLEAALPNTKVNVYCAAVEKICS